MKMKIIAILFMLAMMAVLPFAAAKCGTYNEIKATISTADSAESKDKSNKISKPDKDKVLCGLVAALYKNDYSAETIMAIAILLKNDYSVKPESFDLSDSNVCLYSENADNSTKEIYPQIEKIISSLKELSIYCDDKKIYVPYSEISNGNTIYDEQYSYVSSVASPWDCFSKEYNEKAKCVGVSINGLDYLCKNGMSAEEALSWYLPYCELK